MNNVKVTKQFVEYSKELAEDILGYINSKRNRNLRYHIKRCKMENKNG